MRKQITFPMIVSNYASASQRKELKDFTYVYILLSEKDANRRYTGLTCDLEARLKSHNQGKQPPYLQIPSLAN